MSDNFTVEIVEKEIISINFIETEPIEVNINNKEIINTDFVEEEILNIDIIDKEIIEADITSIDIIHAEGEIRGQGLFELDENLDMMPIETFTQNFEKDNNRDIQPKKNIDFSTIIDDEFELDENLDIMPKS